MKLAVILPSLAGGGMEKVFLVLIKEWIKKGYQVDLVLSGKDRTLKAELPDNIRVFEGGRYAKLTFFIRLIRYLRKERPAHIISGAHDINLMSLLATKIAFVAAKNSITFHNHLTSEIASSQGLKLIKIKIIVLLIRALIKSSNSVIAVSEGVKENILDYFPHVKNKTYVIYNPVITDTTYQNSEKVLVQKAIPNDKEWILFAGRFVHQKGIDVLLKAFQEIKDKTDALLILAGDGSGKEDIKEFIRQNGLQNRVFLIGFVSNIFPWMKKASVFVLPSRHEGLGNVIIEAMYCGTQVISTDCPSGPAEIMNGGEFGCLVPVEDQHSLAEAILSVLRKQNIVETEKLKLRAMDFTATKSADEYLNIFTNLGI